VKSRDLECLRLPDCDLGHPFRDGEMQAPTDRKGKPLLARSLRQFVTEAANTRTVNTPYPLIRLDAVGFSQRKRAQPRLANEAARHPFLGDRRAALSLVVTLGL
jgi:hypothetical protein